MGAVRVVGCQGKLHIAGNLEMARAWRPIGEPDPSNLGVILRRDDDFHECFDTRVAAAELSFVGGERSRVAPLGAVQRMKTSRPYGAAPYVSYVAIGAQGVPCRVRAPARKIVVSPTTISTPRVGY